MIICGHDYTLYVDYDRGNLGRLDLAGKVTYMSARVERDLIQPCRFALKFQDLVAVGLLVPGLVCSGISAAATFLHGQQAGSGQDAIFFKAFVHEYMPRLQRAITHPTDTRVNNYGDWLYHYVRCGLSHSFALEWGHIEGPNLGTYVALSATTGEPQINQNEFVNDFVLGWNKYLVEVSSILKPQLTRDFEARFGQIFHD
jgi:hypothetical protein